MVLSEYRDIVGAMAQVVTIGQFFSPAVMCWDIIKAGDTKDIQVTPFIGGMGMSVLMLKSGYILNDSAMITVNIAGLFLNLIYFSIFYLYTKEKPETLSKLGKAVAFVSALLAYAQIESEERIEFNFGVIVTILMFALLASPLLDLKEIMATKSTAKLPFPLILSGTVVTFLWLLYGLIIENIFMIIQNVVGFALCSFQLSLFVVYPARAQTEESGGRPKVQ